MGSKLKTQLVALCAILMLISMGALSYFHLTLSSQDNLTFSDLAGRRTAALAYNQIVLYLRASPHPDDLLRCLGEARSAALLDSLQRTPGLTAFDIFTPSGQKLMSSGTTPEDDGLQFQQALFWVQEHREPYSEIWGYRKGKVEQLISVGPFYSGRVTHHSYHPLYDIQGSLLGLVHLNVELPKAPVRINLILFGYLVVATIFLISSMLAIYLWAEFSLNRPLKGLNQSLLQLRALDPSREGPDQLPQPNELSEAARALNHVTLDLVKYQQELENKTTRLEQLNEALEQRVAEKTLQIREFFSLITHDLRIPLAAVTGYADLLRNPRSGALSDKQQRYVEHISSANVQAQELVRNLLEAMKYEFGKPAQQPETFDLSVLLNELSGQLALEDKPIEVVADPGQSWQVWGDRTRLARVFGNLMSNALYHAGQVKVELVAEAHQVSVDVSDNGPGIPPDELPHLFEKFKSTSDRKHSSGLGLGLYIVKRILEDHGESITVVSQPGRGTRFHFRLKRGES